MRSSDPLATPEQVQAQIAAQQQDTARALAVPSDRVFPLSARQALAARVSGDAAGLRASRLPALEEALGAQLLPQRRAVLEQVVLEGTQQIEFHAGRHIGDQRRQLAEQMLELRGLRGRNVVEGPHDAAADRRRDVPSSSTARPCCRRCVRSTRAC